ncbi:NAD(P)-dependent oxidoreductase [Streptomyces sp. F-1]|uniref:NAD(P)-dependent oxidoreductase n=1 Tax=Streptomyces sp. F-1 TaxID=463642 RepID=UPI00085BDC89|nr:NAD(P)-dependent oxidoreductase [Streptomyces sp. F-1]SFY49494.1 Phenyllactate dehydrogenase [Streptomyces sp. F-1]
MSADGRIVLVTGTSLVVPSALQEVEARGYTLRRLEKDEITGAELRRALLGASGYIIGGYEEPEAEHFEEAALLEAVAFVGSDYRGFVPGWRRAMELGIAFSATPGANADSVAEFTLLLMLAMARPILGSVARSGADGLITPDTMGPAALELRGLTLGVIGPGRIGTRVATIASAGLGMRVVYAGPHRKPKFESATSARYLEKAELLALSDVVSLHRPGPARGERPEIGQNELEQMKDGALLINSGHPDLVDPTALYQALSKGRIRAASDGLRRSPAWQSLVSLGSERFLCLPQTGFHTTAADLRASSLAVQTVCDVLAGADAECKLIENPSYREVRQTIGRVITRRA